jgi:ethanolamine utilization protein EutQ (cupin superfamily)
MPVTVLPRRPLAPTLDAFYDSEEAFFGTARIVDWTLLRQETSDVHPYDEFAYVLEGELVMESGGASVTVTAGQVGMVPAGSIGRYWTPGFVRMISLGGPNPSAAPSTFFGFRPLDGPPLEVDPAVPTAVHEVPPALLHRVEVPAPNRRYRFESEPYGEAWSSLRFSEWELRAQQQVVSHPFDHFVFVIEGTLLTSTDGRTGAAGAGTMLHVSAGTQVRHAAPLSARVLEVDCANLAGASSDVDEPTAFAVGPAVGDHRTSAGPGRKRSCGPHDRQRERHDQ